MTSLTLDAEPACPAATSVSTAPDAGRPRSASSDARSTTSPRDLGRLAARNPWATPFSGWAFQRAWWDAYGANAHEETLVVVPADAPPGGDPIAIVPLMHRHEVEPGDALTQTTMRHGARRRR